MARRKLLTLNASGSLNGVGKTVNVVQEPLRRGKKEKKLPRGAVAGKPSGKQLDQSAADIEAAHGNARVSTKPKKKPAHVKASRY